MIPAQGQRLCRKDDVAIQSGIGSRRLPLPSNGSPKLGSLQQGCAGNRDVSVWFRRDERIKPGQPDMLLSPEQLASHFVVRYGWDKDSSSMANAFDDPLATRIRGWNSATLRHQPEGACVQQDGAAHV